MADQELKRRMDAAAGDIQISDRAWDAVWRRARRRARRTQLVRAFTATLTVAAAAILVVLSVTSRQEGTQRGPRTDVGGSSPSSSVQTLPLPGTGTSLGLAEGQDVVWVSVAGTQGSPSLLIALDPMTGEETDRIETPEAVREPVEIGGLLWGIVVRDEPAESTALVALDPSTGELVQDLPGIGAPVASNLGSVWALQGDAEGEGVVVEVDAASGIVLRQIDLGTPVWTLLATPERIWAVPMDPDASHGDVMTIAVDSGSVEHFALPGALSVYQPVAGSGMVWIPAVVSGGTVEVHGFDEVTGEPTGSVLNTGASVPIGAYGDLLWTIDEFGVVRTVTLSNGQTSTVAETAILQQISVRPSALMNPRTGAVWVVSSESDLIRVDVGVAAQG